MLVKPHKVEAEKRPTQQCPKCGAMAEERVTKYGIRSSCCDLWSWDRDELVDKATHDARKHLGILLRDLTGTIGAGALVELLRKRTTVPTGTAIAPRLMNEASCKKVIAACEGILIDIIAGDVKAPVSVGARKKTGWRKTYS